MYCLYSSRVVAPIHWISPLAKAGLNMLEASSEPVAPPAPTIVWISSMKRMMSSFFSNSFITAFMRSSNCPRYFVPGNKLAKSKCYHALVEQNAGYFFLDDAQGQYLRQWQIFLLRALLLRSGLFFLRRLKDLGNTFDFFFASNHGIELSFFGHLC